jgi:hypothetical protein
MSDARTVELELARQGDARNCTGCGNVGDLKGDPRRGWCLERRHMVGAGTVCALFTRVHWTERLPHRRASSSS